MSLQLPSQRLNMTELNRLHDAARQRAGLDRALAIDAFWDSASAQLSSWLRMARYATAQRLQQRHPA
jgi:hypothetical protein